MTFFKLTYLTLPEPFKNYEEISKRKRDYKEILYGTASTKSHIYNIVKSCYESYETNKGNLENITAYPHFTANEKNALIHCYTVNTKLVKELKKKIINIQNIFYRTKCVYCGIGEVKYIDHYLPKDDFPEFSIHSFNLVPCCSYCNEKKSTLFLDNHGYRRIYNPYFEELEEQPILECKLVCLESSIESNITIRENMNNQIFLNHLSTVDLIKRYKDELPRKISTVVKDLIITIEETGANTTTVKRVIRRKLNEAERLQGRNSLDALVFRAFLDNDQLLSLNYLGRIDSNFAPETETQQEELSANYAQYINK